MNEINDRIELNLGLEVGSVTKHGWDVVETYQDVISGAESSRPELNRLMEDATAACCWQRAPT